MSVAIPCNTRFKEGYGRYVLYSLLAAAAIHFLLLAFTPPFEFEPYVMPPDGCILLDLAEEIVIPPVERLEAPSPAVRIEPAAAGAEAEEADIPPNFTGELGVPVPTADTRSERAQDYVWTDQLPTVLRGVAPVYPELARLAGIEGRVVLLILIDEKGAVRSATVVESDVTTAMENAAIAAAMRYRFSPAMQGAVPVKVRVAMPFNFRLH